MSCTKKPPQLPDFTLEDVAGIAAEIAPMKATHQFNSEINERSPNE